MSGIVTDPATIVRAYEIDAGPDGTFWQAWRDGKLLATADTLPMLMDLQGRIDIAYDLASWGSCNRCGMPTLREHRCNCGGDAE